MNDRSGPAVPGRVVSTNVAVWGVGAWTATQTWGRSDPRRDPLSIDRYRGAAYWGRHCWSTDFWLRW